MTVTASPIAPITATTPTTSITAVPPRCWTAVCALDRLEPERGVAALVGGRQVAIFLTWAGTVHALDHLDPFSGAHVMARGIVGTRGGVPTVASPMYKQVFDLRTGHCLDDPAVSLPVHEVSVVDGVVRVALADAAGAGAS